jgi:PAS domain S-box-containing protein
MHNSASSNRHYTEGMLHITGKGEILDTTPRALSLLAISNPSNTNLFKDYIFLDNNDYTSITVDKISRKNVSYIIKTVSKKKSKYISATFKQTEDKENYIVSLYDNSELIQKILEFKKQEYHQRLLVSSINDIIFEVNKDGFFLNYWTNKPELLIHPPSTFIGRPLTDVLPQEISSKILYLIRNSIKEKQHNVFQYSLLNANNKQEWYSLTIKNIPDQDEIVAAVITDITKQKDYQEKLIFSEKKFYQAFHFSGIGTTLTSLEGYLIEGNNTVSTILGYSRKELQHIRSIDITHPEDKAFDLSVRSELVQGKKNHQTFLKRYLHKENYYVWCSITISLVRDNSKNPQYFIVQLVDMTEFIRNNEELIIKKKKLETIKAQLESKILQNEEANHIIAHNLLNPIANIKMLINNFKETKEKDIVLDLLSSCCDELDETVADLNAIASNINNSLNNHEIEYCRFNEILDKIIEIKQPLISKKKAKIITDFQVQEIKTQRVALYSIVDQLLDNALQFSDDTRPPLIQLKTYYTENNIVFSIQDNGSGMDLNKVKSQLFMFKKIFHRGFDTKGIGLNITKYQVESLGGKIDVISTPNEGTTFFVKLPDT